jgi:hypothetical protein
MTNIEIMFRGGWFMRPSNTKMMINTRTGKIKYVSNHGKNEENMTPLEITEAVNKQLK